MLSKASGSSFPALFYSKKRLETKISFYIWSDTYKDSTSMKHYLYILFLLFLLLPPIHAQKVGLVLSGGGAKGLTHIGIIRALEENGIPIDYIAGTSMGAIVGSLYAMGYSPDEMEALLKSDDFKRWYSGNVEEKYIYYFKKNPPTPEFINIRISLKDSLKNVKPQFLPTSIVDPIQMNIVFLQLFGQATAASKANFDSLYIPFRCIASDVYNKRPLILKKGDLGDAVRASMSFPAMFKPIEIDSILAYDGGIYNNFPVNVMRDTFHPDIIIGSAVSANPGKPKEGDIMGQLENMIMQKTDYSLPDSLGILMTFKYDDVNLMDFQRFDELHDIGYKRAIEMMDSIKSRIHRRITPEQVKVKRLAYKSNLPDFLFKRFNITGAIEQQKQYIQKEFHENDSDVFTMEDVKRAYFRLLSDNIISEIIPHAVYNEKDQTYDLNLQVKMEANLSVRVGGNVSSSGSNQVYFGASYQNLNYYSKEFNFDGQLGRVYNNVQLAARIDFPTKLPTSYKFIASISTFDYFKEAKFFSNKDNPAFNKKREEFVKLKVSLPFLSRKKAEFGMGIARMEDRYFQTNIIDFSETKHDESTYSIFGGSIVLEGSTLNARQFATQGSREKMAAQIFTGTEHFRSGVSKVTKGTPEPYKKVQSWLQVSYQNETYHKVSPKFTLGAYLEAYYSSRNFSNNYTATLMQAGEFTPTAHSKVTYNEAFRANQYAGVGTMPIYQLSESFQLRGEFYGFIPIFPIKKDEYGQAYYGKAFTKFEYLGEISLVFQLSFGSISAYVNHYSSPSNDWNVGLTLGWQLFNSRFVE